MTKRNYCTTVRSLIELERTNQSRSNIVRRLILLLVFGVAGGWSHGVAASIRQPDTKTSTARVSASRTVFFAERIVPLLARYCYDCHGNGKHKGDVTLDSWKSDTDALADRKTWERVLQMVGNHEMPPKNKPQP